jgi:hypothetical protein
MSGINRKYQRHLSNETQIMLMRGYQMLLTKSLNNEIDSILVLES